MKTSQKEGVSDRPPTPDDLPKHEASQLNADRWCRFGALGRRTSRFGYSRCSHSAPPPDGAPTTPPPARSTSNRVSNGFLSHRPIFAVSAGDLDILGDRCRKQDVDGLRVRSADGWVTIKLGPGSAEGLGSVSPSCQCTAG